MKSLKICFDEPLASLVIKPSITNFYKFGGQLIVYCIVMCLYLHSPDTDHFLIDDDERNGISLVLVLLMFQYDKETISYLFSLMYHVFLLGNLFIVHINQALAFITCDNETYFQAGEFPVYFTVFHGTSPFIINLKWWPALAVISFLLHVFQFLCY